MLLPAPPERRTRCDPVRAIPPLHRRDETAETEEEYTERICAPRRSGEQCGRARSRTTAGGGNTGNVSHKGWPAITGVLWKVTAARARTASGRAASDNDELLGHHGNDTVIGGEGKDVLWGDWELAGNGASPVRRAARAATATTSSTPATARTPCTAATGTTGSSPTTATALIDCGPGKSDYAQTRWQSNAYKVKNCEHIRHFCAFGSKPNGDCKKPGESAFAVLSRQASHKALLAFLDAW